MDRPAYYRALRARDNDLFGSALSQRQVDGMEALLDAMHGYPLDHAAHVLAECYHETGGGMYPVKETVYRHSKNKNPSDAKVIARLDAAWKKGQLSWVREPYWREGWFGRGLIQLTHLSNYRNASALVGVDLVSQPDRALDVAISAEIAAEGCRVGLFTGAALSDYDGETYDHYNARDIVNGDKRKNGQAIATHAESFTEALVAGDWGYPPRPDVEPVEPSGSSYREYLMWLIRWLAEKVGK